MTANGEQVAELGVKQGWLKVRDSKAHGNLEEHEATLDHLHDLEDEAKEAKLGMWSTDESGERDVSFTFDGDARAFVNKYKGQPLDGINYYYYSRILCIYIYDDMKLKNEICYCFYWDFFCLATIEQIRDASTYRVLLTLPDKSQQYITLLLTGIKAPACKRDNAPESVSEPFGEEGKFFVETRLLQRGVKVLLEGTNGQNFVGSVKHPAGNIAELLLANGYAKCVDWSITLVTGGPVSLRNAEK